MIKKVEVLIDLFGYGILNLSVDYHLSCVSDLPGVYCTECHIHSYNHNEHSWLCTPDFKFFVSEIESGSGHVIHFNTDGLRCKNPYYQTMLNVVSDYIFMRERFFI